MGQLFRDQFYKKINELAIESSVYHPKGQLNGYADILDENDVDLTKREHEEENFEENLDIQKDLIEELEQVGENYEILHKYDHTDRIKNIIKNYTSGERLKIRSSKLMFNKINKLEEEIKSLSDKNLDDTPYPGWIIFGIFIIICITIIILFNVV